MPLLHKPYSPYKCSVIALALFTAANGSFAQVPKDRLTTQKIQAKEDWQKMSDARAKRKNLLSKRHDMRDAQTRADVVRQLREADEELRNAVHRQAKARGLEIEGDMPNGGRFVLIDFDDKGAPVYDETMNLDAAITTAADVVRDNAAYRVNQIEAEVAFPSNHSGIQLETCNDVGGGQNVAYIENGDWTEYAIDIPVAGEYWIEVRIASNNNDGGTINLSSNSSPIGSITVPDTNGWQTWVTRGTYVTFPTSGTKVLRMDFAGGAGSLFNVNWLNFSEKLTIGLWEASGIPRVTHRELEGHVTIMDGSTSTSNHASHVAGTLVARGINANTLGMAPQASVAAFTSSGANSEMMANGAAAPNTADIYVSNHSYGSTRGWKYDGGWKWQGEYTDGGNQADFYDEEFGRYDDRSEEWDNIAYNLPYYLIFTSAGNARGNVPNEGDSWTYQDGFSTVTVDAYDPLIHPLGNRYYKGDNNGYDTIEGGSVAKNAIAVGNSDEGIDGNGVRDPGSATAQSSSCRGPTDDGRIKPDIHGNGTGLTSSISNSDTATASYSGTSMASPNVCGSAALLIDYYRALIPDGDMRASTLKALILHTADDRGKSGPDYKYGWGVMNTEAAANVIQAHAHNTGGGGMFEAFVNNTTTTSQTHSFEWDGTSDLRVTLCWTDPAGEEIDAHDSRVKALVNDLNLKVTGPGSSIHLPYVMPYVGDWSNAKFESKAVPGVNDVDTVEQVYVASPTAGNYTVTVDFVGSLTNNEQVYSLIVTGQDAVELSEVDAWRLENFGHSSNIGIAADEADQDNDGMLNFTEFLLATDPQVSNPQPVSLTKDEDSASMTYRRNIDAMGDYDYQVYWADELTQNPWSTDSVTEEILSTNGSVQEIKASTPADTETKRFFQLRVSPK
ncbi:MAG: S8 family serine peptidase [Opitutaceae bacterium]